MPEEAITRMHGLTHARVCVGDRKVLTAKPVPRGQSGQRGPTLVTPVHPEFSPHAADHVAPFLLRVEALMWRIECSTA